jgi:phage-related minor tail protein
MLAPGEIGPMTELQTVVENSNAVMDLLKPTPAERALENNMSVITDSTGMKVRIVEDLTKGIDEDTATFGGTSNKGDDANNTANINANALNIGISTDQAVANMGKGVENTFTSGLTDLFSGNKLNTDRMLLGLANLAKGQAASWITGIIVKAAVGEAVGGSSGTEDWEAVSDGYAKGGVLSGGFRAFASGGVVHKPTLGLIGEGNYNEAVVPLPDGKSIPVIGAGGNTNNNNFSINVTVNSDGSSESSESSQAEGNSSARQAAALGEMLTHSIQQELVKQQRPGGLLSDY